MKTFDDAEAFIDFINHPPEDMSFDHALGLIFQYGIPINFVKDGSYLSLEQDFEKESRKEPGCLMYSINSSFHSPTIFWKLEQWATIHDLQKHFKTDLIKEVMSKYRELGVKITGIIMYKVGL